MKNIFRILSFIFGQLFFVAGIVFLIYVAPEFNTINVLIEDQFTFINYWLWIILALLLISVSIPLAFISQTKHLALIIERDAISLVFSIIALFARLIITTTMPTIYTSIGYFLVILVFIYSVSLTVVDLVFYFKHKKAISAKENE